MATELGGLCRDILQRHYPAGGRSAFHILAGAAEMVDEGVFIVADFGLALFETTGRILGYDVRFNSYSNVMQALDSGGLSLKEYYTSFLFDMATLGLYGKAQICYDYYRGNMTSDEFSRQLGGQSLLELSAMRGPKASRSVSGPNGTVTVNIGSSATTIKGEIPPPPPRSARPWHLNDPYVVYHTAPSDGPQINPKRKGITDYESGDDWSPGKPGDPRKNAENHYNDHKADFPELNSVDEYVDAAHEFKHMVEPGKVNTTNGDLAYFDPSTNTFLLTCSYNLNQMRSLFV